MRSLHVVTPHCMRTKQAPKRRRVSDVGHRRVGHKAGYRAKAFGSGAALSLERDLNYVDTAFSYASTNTVTTTSLNLCTQGSSPASRYGDRTLNMFINWNFFIRTGTAQVTEQGLRCLLVYDAQPNSAIPGGSLPLASASVTAHRDADYRQRFYILRDWFMLVFPAGTGGSGYSNDSKKDVIQKGYQKVNLPSQFTGNAGTIVDIVSGSLLLCTIGDTASGVNVTPQIIGTFRVIFKS